ncbi:MAG: hypothetical protein ABI823_21520 [Bryobacteraceae bacterium]
MQTRRIIVVAALTLALAAMASAQKPNFSGTWKLDPAKSDFGPQPVPDTMSVKVTHDDPKLKIFQSGPQGDSEMAFTTDGKEVTNQMQGMDVKGVAKWEGAALVVDNKLDLGGTEVTFKQTYALSEDGKVLTNKTHIVSPQGEFDMKIVFNKQ